MGAPKTIFDLSVCLFSGLLLSLLITYTTTSRTNVSVVAVPVSFRSTPAVERGDALSNAAREIDGQLGAEAADTQALDPLHEKARAAFRSGDPETALRLIREVRRDHPDDAGVLNDVGVYAMNAGHAPEAEAAFGEAVAKDPSNARAHYNLGTLRLKRQNLEEAEASFTRALEINAYYAEARYNRAIVRTRRGNVAGAAQDYEAVTRSDHSTTAAKAFQNLGVLFAKDGRVRDAIDAFRGALRLRPDSLEARFNVALLLARAGSDEQAADEYRKLLTLQNDHRAANLNLGVLLMRREQWPEAEKHFELWVARKPDDAAARYNLALCRSRRGDDAGAIAALSEAVKLDRDYGEAHYNLGLALKRTGKLDAAIEHFRRAVELRKDDAESRYNLALALTETNRSSDAVAQYRAAIELNPTYFRALYNVGLLEYRAEQYGAAAKDFERALKAQPESYSASYNLGLALLKLDRPRDAEDVLRKALAYEDTVEANYSLGLALDRQSESKEAAAFYRAALELDPKHVRSHGNYAELLSKLSHHEEALSHLERVAKLEPADPTAFNLGLGLYRAGKFENALAYFRLAGTSSGPVRKKATSMHGATLARLGRPGEAIAVYETALEEYPGDALILRNLARALAQKGDHEAALSRLENLNAREPDDPQTTYLIGEQYQALGRADLAAAQFKRVLERKPDDEQARQALVGVTGTAH